MIPALNDLCIAELERLILHEAHDTTRLVRVREDIENEGVQRNPVIVAPYEDLYLVLDGAHRVLAFRELGCRFALVQIVRLPEKAESWGHLLDAPGLQEALRSIEELEVLEALPEWGCLAEACFYGGERLFVKARREGLVPAVRALQRLQDAYPEDDTLVRRVDPGKPVELAVREALLLYRRFTPNELVEIVSKGEELPAGVTRFVVEECVLNVRYPLGHLAGGELGARNEELMKFVRRSWEGNRVRYYTEPVVLFE
ncbi:MAG: ParB N-terminal domain-containing protein [Actinomycetota bacterium]|nr:ParB N-terminal domain-containing protein [Actinomycetota bacterium]